MVDTIDFVNQVERELRSTRTASQSTRQAWENLSSEARPTFAPAMDFLGFKPNGAVGHPAREISGADRVAAVRLMLVKLSLDTDDPKWSSDVLDRLIRAVVESPSGGVGDLICAMLAVLGDYAPKLTMPVAGFIKDIIVKCFTRHQRSYESVPWQSLVESLGSKPTQAQLYLALHAIPPQFVPAQLSDTIATELESTAFHAEAVSALAS